MQEMPGTTYHGHRDVLSSSMLKDLLVSPAHFMSNLMGKKSSKQMDLGTVMHMLVLEPHTAASVVALYPGPLNTVDGRAFSKANCSRIVMSLQEYLQMQHGAGLVMESGFRGRPFYRYVEEGVVEPSVFYKDPNTGVACRTRPDLHHPDFTFDLKTTRHISLPSFQADAIARHYDLQAYMYSLARCIFEGTSKPKEFIFVPVESSAPYSTCFRPASVNFLENGRAKYEAALGIYKACMTTDYWPAPNGEAELDLMPWQQYKSNFQELVGKP
ncbi:PD-(D/E)XK nuclease-like domain-containing protein [Acidovorax sp. FHTAMBA]|jgi:hypothetical protein|uniref:PD-(D/E)XK nuclease-like domain-containing protein n=1 Tax=Acidovorax sp. FHTAMBA TaxID=3140252 RepID=UPI0015F5D4F7